MKDYKIYDILAMMFGYMVASLILLTLTGTFLSAWLGFNALLAMIPMLLITLVYKRIENNEFAFDKTSVVLMVVFVFFLPNAFYVITDMIHIDFSNFYEVDNLGNAIYFRNIEEYILIFHILITVLIGIYAGVKSLLRFEDIFKKRGLDKKSIFSLISIIMILSAIGIYIGRFLRFFSWDILFPLDLLKDLYHSIDFFAILFLILFYVIQVTLYYGYKLLFENEPF